MFAAFIACVGCAPTVSVTHASTTGPAQLDQIGFDQHIGADLPLSARFADEQGLDDALARYFGSRPVVLLLGYHECPNLCSTVRQSLLRSLRASGLQPGIDYEVLAVSIDPQEDATAAAHARSLALADAAAAPPTSGWHFLTGNESSIAALAGSVGFRYAYDEAQHQYAHPAGIVIATPRGRVAAYLPGVDYPTAALRQTLLDAGQDRLAAPVRALLLLCLHYDPVTGRYSATVETALRMLALGTAGGLAALIIVLQRRRKPPAGAA